MGSSWSSPKSKNCTECRFSTVTNSKMITSGDTKKHISFDVEIDDLKIAASDENWFILGMKISMYLYIDGVEHKRHLSAFNENYPISSDEMVHVYDGITICVDNVSLGFTTTTITFKDRDVSFDVGQVELRIDDDIFTYRIGDYSVHRL